MKQLIALLMFDALTPSSVALLMLIFALVLGTTIGLISYKLLRKKQDELTTKFLKILNEYGLTFSDTLAYFCKYVGGHPERDGSSRNLLFGAKNGKLIFFDSNILIIEEGNLTYERVRPYIGSKTELIHLFDIPINSIADIRYFDATTSSTIAVVGGDHWATPIRMNKGDASVLIDWNDGKYNHSTEFRFAGIIQANKRANTLRNTLIRIT